MMRVLLALILTGVVCSGCQLGESSPARLSAYTPENHLRVVVEVPAGTNHQVYYDSLAKTFVVRQTGGEDQVVNFLPYPANLGFVPSTRFAYPAGPAPLRALILAESLPSAVSMAVKPVALMQLKQKDKPVPYLLTVPAYPARRILTDTTFAGLKTHHPALLEILKLWFINHEPTDSLSWQTWQDEKAAAAWVERSLVTDRK